jgi:hypothetical protein
MSPLLTRHSFVHVRIASERLAKWPFLTNLSIVSISFWENPQLTIVFAIVFTDSAKHYQNCISLKKYK